MGWEAAMPFDKLCVSKLRLMRLATAALFMTAGLALVILGGLEASQPIAGALPSHLAWAPPVSALVFGVLVASAGMMLLELTTKSPMKVALTVPFVAANVQVALSFGLIAVGVAVVSGGFSLVNILVFATFVMNLLFATMTKVHWNFTENTGKKIPS
ncbi:MAG: hypothetical protein ACJATT_004630 [Myxococcota bacterium]|jgi:hypothetical protein